MYTIFADGGELTAARRTAAFVYGSWTVLLPQGQEQVEHEERLKDGYVARVNGKPRGRFDNTFVRADASVDMESATTNLEVVLDEAFARTDGDVFFQRAITGVGLNGTRPGADYRVGDMVRVGLWGKFLELPVTAITYTAGKTGGVPTVVVGGELVRDRRATKRLTDELRKSIAAERAQRMQAVGKVSTTATLAAHTASAADGKAQAAESRARAAASAASTADSKAETADAKAVAAKERAEEAIRRWRAAKDEADARHDELIAKNKELVRELDERTVGMVHVRHDTNARSTTHGVGVDMPQNSRWLLLVARPGFVGSMSIDVYYSNGSVVPFAYDSTDFELVSDWRGWSHRNSYFDSLAVGNRMLAKWVELPLGNVLAARVLIDHVVWNRS